MNLSGYFLILVLFQNKVEKIEIKIDPIYENAHFPYTIVNFIHIETRARKIKSLLLFKEGDSVNEFILSESERILRQTGVFRKVKISSSPRYDTVYVYIQDLFSFSLFLDYSGGGNRIKYGGGIQEHNFLGNLMDIGFFYTYGFERQYFKFQYLEPSFLFSSFDLFSEWTKTKTGDNLIIALNSRRTPLVSRSFYFNFFQRNDYDYIYENNTKKDSIYVKDEKVSLEILRNLSKKGNWRAPGIGASYLSIFSQNSLKRYYSLDPFLILGSEKYIKTKFLRKFGDDEDFFKGFWTKTYFHTDFVNNKGWTITLKVGISVGNIFSQANMNIENFLEKSLNLNILFFYRLIDHITFGIRALYATRKEVLSGSPYYTIGGINGMRGYDAFYFQTKEFLLTNYEIRLFGPEILKSFALGGVLFVDMGKFRGYNGIYYNFGIGIRGEITRSYNFPIFRFDMALRDFSFQKMPIFSFGEGQTF